MNELLFEIGCEEIPAGVVPVALAYMAERASKLGADYNLAITGDVKTFGTPRRLCVSITGLPEATARTKKELLGPALKAAFDADGKATGAAEGFAKTAGIPADKLARKQTPKGEYLYAEIEEGGEATALVLERFLHDLIAKLPFPKSMRWANESVKFSRPVQWIVAVLSTDWAATVLPIVFGDVKAGNLTRGHRFMANDPCQVGRREDYTSKLKERFVIADPSERKQRVIAEARKAAKEAGGFLFYDVEGGAKFDKDPLTQQIYFSSLVDEVTFLCETPFGVFGTYSKDAMELPREVVLTAMRNHQRYFGVCDANGQLLPAFVTIAASRVKDPAFVRRGNQRALQPRLADASYFFVEDQKRPLASRIDDLKTVTYHKKIGSSYEKVQRVAVLAERVAKALGMSSPHLADACQLAKADLTTLMVGEFPELQGIVGAHYARRAGVALDIAIAIRDHYRPRSADDAPAGTDLAAIIAIADKLDTIAGIIAIGQTPTGSRDPFALRRSALGVLRTIFDRNYNLDIPALLAGSYAPELITKIQAFIADRLLNFLLPEKPGPDADAVRAVVAAGADRPLEARYRSEALQKLMQAEDFSALVQTLKRAINILKEPATAEVDPAHLLDASEKELHQKTSEAAAICAKLRAAPSTNSFHGILTQVAALRLPVDAFFKAVMVNDKDPAIKANRTRLLRNIVALTAGIADFAKL